MRLALPQVLPERQRLPGWGPIGLPVHLNAAGELKPVMSLAKITKAKKFLVSSAVSLARLPLKRAKCKPAVLIFGSKVVIVPARNLAGEGCKHKPSFALI